MLIIKCDDHPGFQQIACVDTDTGELSEARLARPVQKVRFARGRARTSRWCAVITDVLIGHPAPSAEGVRTSNHDRSK